MSEVKRYDPMRYDRLSGYMQQHPEGDYVRHADYAALEAECEALREALEDALAFTLEHDSGRAGVVRGRIVAALSAQQSAHVSVPRDIALALLDDGPRAETWAAQAKLRALLNRGEA